MKTIKTYLLICMAVLGAILLLPSQNLKAATVKSAAASGRQIRVEKSTVTVDFDNFSTSGYTYSLINPKNVQKNLNPKVSVSDVTANGVTKTVVHASVNISKYSKGLYSIIVKSKANEAESFTIGFYNHAGITSVSPNYSKKTFTWKDGGSSVVGPTGEKPYYQVRYYTNENNISVPGSAATTKHYKPGVTSAPFLSSWKSGTYYAVVIPFIKTTTNANYYGPALTVSVSLVSTPENVAVTETGYQKASVSWKKVSGATAYVVKNVTTGKSFNVAGTETSYAVTGLTAGKTYRFTVAAKNGSRTSAASTAVSLVTTKPTTKKVTNLTVSGSKGSHTISWNSVSDVDGYKVYFKKQNDSSYEVIGATASTKMFTKRMNTASNYVVMVKPYTLIGKEKVTEKAGAATTTVDLAPAPSVTVRTMGFYSKTTKKSKVYNTYTSTTVAANIPSGAKVEQIDFVRKKQGNRCKILYNGKTYYINKSNIKSYGENYTKTPYSTAVKENYINNTIKDKAVSSTSYLIWISHYTQKVTIFKGSKGNWKVLKTFDTATGKHSTRSPMGYTMKTTYKETGWFYARTYERWVTHYAGRNSFHTRVHYNNGGYADATINRPASHGCARLYDADAKYIYDNIPKNTRVISW